MGRERAYVVLEPVRGVPVAREHGEADVASGGDIGVEDAAQALHAGLGPVTEGEKRPPERRGTRREREREREREGERD